MDNPSKYIKYILIFLQNMTKRLQDDKRFNLNVTLTISTVILHHFSCEISYRIYRYTLLS